MIRVRLYAEDLKLLKSARTESELRGCVNLILEHVETAYRERAEEKAKPRPERGERFTVPAAVAILKEMLGDSATLPPFPSAAYFAIIRRVMNTWALDEAKIRAFAEKIKTSLEPPYSISWAFNNYERIMAGKVFGQGRKQSWRKSDTQNFKNNPEGRNKYWYGGGLDSPMEVDTLEPPDDPFD